MSFVFIFTPIVFLALVLLISKSLLKDINNSKNEDEISKIDRFNWNIRAYKDVDEFQAIKKHITYP